MKPAAILLTLTLTVPAHADDPAPAIDLDLTARILGGTAEPSEVAENIRGHYAGYRKYLEEKWTNLDQMVLTPASDWAKTEVPKVEGTVFYPFSGPDLLTSAHFYPNASRHILVALEKAGPVPAFDKLTPGQFGMLLRQMRGGMKRFFKNGFFTTSVMKDKLGHADLLKGVGVVMLTFAARNHLTVKSIVPIRVAADGSKVEPHPGDPTKRATWDSWRMETTSKDGRKVTVDYVHMNIGDSSLNKRKHKHHRTWLEKIAANHVLLKAASHLMQTKNFVIMRDLLLKHATSVMQDDSGLPYLGLKRHFEVKLYGDYEKQNQLFGLAPQPALKAAYAKKEGIAKLPFKYGYRKTAGSCVLIGQRRR